MPGDILVFHARAMLKAGADMASLRVRSSLGPAREQVVQEAAFTACLQRLTDEAGSVRVFECIAALIVEKGRANGLDFDEIIATTMGAIRDAAVARIEQERADAEAQKAKGGS